MSGVLCLCLALVALLLVLFVGAVAVIGMVVFVATRKKPTTVPAAGVKQSC